MAAQSTTFASDDDTFGEVPLVERNWVLWAVASAFLVLVALGFFFDGMQHMAVPAFGP